MDALTINEDGSPVLVEALYARHYGLYTEECDTVEDAISYLEAGADYGEIAAIGVLVDGEPTRYGSFDPKPPTDQQATEMRTLYARIKDLGEGSPTRL